MKPIPTPKPRPTLVFDASVGINLLATGRIEDILTAIDSNVLLEDKPAGEIIRHPRGEGSVAAEFDRLVSRGLLTRFRLAGPMYETFIDLVGATPPDDLGDGEAAVLAYASHTQTVAVLDESRGRRIAATRWPSMNLASTADLLADERVRQMLGEGGLQEAVVGALVHGRMRVLPPLLPWVQSVVPASLLAECRSLPRAWRVQNA